MQHTPVLVDVLILMDITFSVLIPGRTTEVQLLTSPPFGPEDHGLCGARTGANMKRLSLPVGQSSGFTCVEALEQIQSMIQPRLA